MASRRDTCDGLLLDEQRGSKSTAARNASTVRAMTLRASGQTVIATLAVALTCAVPAIAGAQVTYVPNCGNTSYLEFKPRYWSSGCTGGSLNMSPLHWRRWGGDSARARGTAELRESCAGEDGFCGTYKAHARLRLSAPRLCHDRDGRARRYFSLARFSVRYRAGNPFGYRAGWRAYRVEVGPHVGSCAV